MLRSASQSSATPLGPSNASPRGRRRWEGFVDSRLLAVEAAILLAAARLLVKHVRLRHWRSWLTTAAGEASAISWQRLPSVVHVRRVVPRAAALVPFSALCLPQAMAGQWMLRRRGVASRLSFGARRRGAGASAGAQGAAGNVASDGSRSGHMQRRFFRDTGEPHDEEQDGLEYHAWLSVNGVCVLGGPVDSYAELPPFDAIAVGAGSRGRR